MFAVVAAVSTCVLAFILIALYFNQQAMKRIAHLLADDDVLGDRIAQAKVEVTPIQWPVCCCDRWRVPRSVCITNSQA